MFDRWRGRFAGLAVAATFACLAGIAAVNATAQTTPALVVRDPAGALIARVPLAPGGEFTLRYRNSLYHSLAEERFVVTDAGQLRLVELAADELAVLEEYYAIDQPAVRSDGDRAWTAVPALPVEEATLRIAATDRGQRTLIVEGQPSMELWRFVDDGDPSVLLEVDS
jgi:hypothetical protein